jgi:glycosyltransferase involved in cell wall biosynthesis
MPKVSILIPAFRPDYLDVCLASALAQTSQDFEILIGDDSPGDDIERVLLKWQDPRIRYTRNPNRGTPASNRNMLIGLASGDYIKFLFDDDLLLPASIQTLCAVADATGAKLVFHGHFLMDQAGRTAQSPTPIADGTTVALDREQLFDHAIRPPWNFIGGPVSTLIHTATLRAMPNAFGLESNRMRFLTDMALYSNFVDQGHQLIGVGIKLAAFRVHAQQTSGAASPVRAAGLFEWEYLVRWAGDRWPVDFGNCVETLKARHASYRPDLERFPQLQRFIDLGPEPDADGKFCTDEFRRVLEECWAMIDRAGTVAPAPAAPAA